MPLLPRDDRRELLRLARRAIVDSVSQARQTQIPILSENLLRPSGAFVTLYRNRRLRGCIGRIEPVEALAKTVVHCAAGAALHDPRFSPVCPEEIAELTIEISVLSLAQPIRPEDVQVGTHGLVVQRDQFRGVLLPKVAAERGWSREKFLDETCQKAGLPPDSWRDPRTECLAFTDEAFSEADFEQPLGNP